MQLRELLSGIEILEANLDLNTEISGISYDSRKTEPGNLFVAISGFETDGHKYIPAALNRGAAAVLCEIRPEEGVPFVLVPDCRTALAAVSVNYFHKPAEKLVMIGITGTNGKTTSSYIIKHILEACTGERIGLIGTINNMIGDRIIPSDHTTPESYELQKLLAEMADSGCRYVVMEVSSHSLKLGRVAGIHFDVTAFTNLTQDHLDFHHTMEDYAASKKKLFYNCSVACINEDDAYSAYFLDGLPCVSKTYSVRNEKADFHASHIFSTDKGVSFELIADGEVKSVQIPIPGDFSVYNALGAIAVCSSLGIPLSEIVEALKSSSGVKGRLEVLPVDTDYSVIIDYAHTPDALKNIVHTLKPLTRGRLITLFGCGGDRDHSKRPIMGAAAAEGSDLCIVTSDNPRTEDPDTIIQDILSGFLNSSTPYIVIRDRIEAIHWAIDNARSGDVILLAGKGHEDYQVIGHSKHHFDEREIVLSYLEEKHP